MATDLAELSSLSSTLEQLTRRVGAMGESARVRKQEDVANELFNVERALSGAQRRISRLMERSS